VGKSVFLGAVLFAMLAGAAIICDTATAVPPGRTFRYPGGDMGVVVFSGSLHYEEGFACMDCHIKVFGIRRRSPDEMIKWEDHLPGRLCGVCHDGDRAFGFDDLASCRKCHSFEKNN
jgi:c(7)-type cytochrome triheme protein